MKIVVLSTSFPSRATASVMTGGGNFVLNECLAFERQGARVVVLTPDMEGCPPTETYGSDVRVHRLRYFWPRRWQRLRRTDGRAMYDGFNLLSLVQLPLLLLAFAVAAIRHGRDADIVHCNWSFTALATLPLRWFWRVPVVCTTRGSDLRLVPKWLNSFIFTNIDGVVDCFGPDYRKLFAGISGHFLQLPVITPNPGEVADVRSQLVGPGEKLLLLMGRFDRVKLEKYGMPFFLLQDAVARLRAKHPLRCIFLGSGPLEPEMRAHAARLGVEDCVEFAGFRDDVYPYLQAADLVLGGLGLNAVAQEASILRKLQVMPRIPYWYESIWLDRTNVLLFDPDDLDSLCAALDFALSHPDDVSRMIANLAATTRQYVDDLDGGGRTYVEAFRRIAAGQRPVSPADAG